MSRLRSALWLPDFAMGRQGTSNDRGVHAGLRDSLRLDELPAAALGPI